MAAAGRDVAVSVSKSISWPTATLLVPEYLIAAPADAVVSSVAPPWSGSFNTQHLTVKVKRYR